MQETWKCCGIEDANDWERNTYFAIASKEVQSPEAGGVPFSCCVNSSETMLKNFYCGHGVRLKEQVLHSTGSPIYTEGCLPKLQLWLSNNVFLVGICLVVAAIIQFLGICFAQNLKSDIFAQRAKCCLGCPFAPEFRFMHLDQLIRVIYVISCISTIGIFFLGKPAASVKIESLLFGKKEKKPTASLNELVAKLPDASREYMLKELPMRRMSALVYLLIVCSIALPIWWITTDIERVPFDVLPETYTIDFNIRVHFVRTSDVNEKELDSIVESVMDRLIGAEVVRPLTITWTAETHIVQSVETAEEELWREAQTEKEELHACVVLVPPSKWTLFSATTVHLSSSHCAFIQLPEKDTDKEKMLNRLYETVWDILVDIPHLNNIVRRDLRQHMQPHQIAILPLSHQKRLVWDSVPLASHYIVQIVYVHGSPDALSSPCSICNRISKSLRILATLVQSFTSLTVSSEHLWDYDVRHLLEKDVQNRWTLSHNGMDQMLKDVEAQLHTVELGASVLKLLVVDFEDPIILLDQDGEDSNGVAVASWGAILAKNEKADSQIINAMRMLLGLDSDLLVGWTREAVALCEWEKNRAYLRALLDNAMRAASATRALKKMTENITTIAIKEHIAAKANEAKRLIEEGLGDGNAPHLNKIVLARELADSALSDPSLLDRLYMPRDERFAIYLPIALPTLLSVCKAAYDVFIWILESIGLSKNLLKTPKLKTN
ncbi:hypothetical protein WR25_20422 [Diploscapter pachys]|uniref:Uncharacterized protein n=1 Tax=Diploscapter pachys TaxID=2018661 RepID=A0A2A2JLY6_9BILA|nr:hypothetical protein WR25_20422 [Diploscapter pachys]